MDAAQERWIEDEESATPVRLDGAVGVVEAVMVAGATVSTKLELVVFSVPTNVTAVVEVALTAWAVKDA